MTDWWQFWGGPRPEAEILERAWGPSRYLMDRAAQRVEENRMSKIVGNMGRNATVRVKLEDGTVVGFVEDFNLTSGYISMVITAEDAAMKVQEGLVRNVSMEASIRDAAAEATTPDLPGGTRWETPPEPVRNTRLRDTQAALLANPGEWALIKPDGPMVFLPWWQPLGADERFEVRHVRTDDKLFGTSKVYARAVAP